ncbi:MAG: valine--tRNA ligase, partial [Deltaproteobacteria bacterium]|nr:valine--tRNA ligase [Deltaproteobacteria bacterium]
DTAVAVNPKDERYTHLVGKRIRLPETNREIPIIADDFVDASFGSGAVKVTPAHDPNDFAIGQRHNLPRINVMNDDATMNDEAGSAYAGLKREACRKKLVAAFEAAGLLERIEDYTNAVGHCYRCHTVIEPRLSDQWFVKMRPLAEAAIRATEEGKVRFHPERWTDFYLQWLGNARDWCISRQIWWGHRIPVWYCASTEERGASVRRSRLPAVASAKAGGEGGCPPIVSRETPSQCPHCGGSDLRQDDDVLDTWFSSALWPFSTLGWPSMTETLKHYYPTSVLSTDRGIIYFWVARMVMMGLKFMKQPPFSDVYIHGTILDEQGRKMSKSLGNGIDPLDIIAKYGADAMRFSLVILTTEGQDLKLSESKFEMGRNFCNKLWNASRFALMNLEGMPSSAVAEKNLSLADRWILHQLEHTIRETHASLEAFHFHDAAQGLYRFIWNDLCDWYVEAAKPALLDGNNALRRGATQQTLHRVLTVSLKLLHPFLPFITEEIWQQFSPSTSIMVADYPRPAKKISFEKEATEFECIKAIVTAIRTIRSEHGVPPVKRIAAFVSGVEKKKRTLLESYQSIIMDLARLETFTLIESDQKPKQAAVSVVDGMEVLVPHEGLIDIAAERTRLTKEIAKTKAEHESVEKKLANESFVKHAPPALVEQQRVRLNDAKEKLIKLEKALEALP